MNIMRDTKMSSKCKNTLKIYNTNLRIYLNLLNVKDVAKNVKCFL